MILFRSKLCSFKSCNDGATQALGKVSGAKKCREAEDDQGTL